MFLKNKTLTSLKIGAKYVKPQDVINSNDFSSVYKDEIATRIKQGYLVEITEEEAIKSYTPIDTASYIKRKDVDCIENGDIPSKQAQAKVDNNIEVTRASEADIAKRAEEAQRKADADRKAFEAKHQANLEALKKQEEEAAKDVEVQRVMDPKVETPASAPVAESEAEAVNDAKVAEEAEAAFIESTKQETATITRKRK